MRDVPFVAESGRDGTRGEPSSRPDASGTIRDRLAAFLDDPAARWSLGGFGAGAEFGRAPGEPIASLGRFGRLTPRGALILAPADALVPVAYETGFRGGWSHAVALCLPMATGLVPGPEVVTALGLDREAARPEDRGGLLFDLGLALPQGSACLRTRDREHIALLEKACGDAAFVPGSPVPGLLAARRVDVVTTTRLGRIEVFAGVGAFDTAGPRAFVAPEVVRMRRTHAATAPIPPGLVPCAHLHPPHPGRDADGRAIPFDGARHAAFQALLALWGDPGRVALKARLGAGEALPRDADRADRGVARVVAAQAEFVARDSRPRPSPPTGKMVPASSRDVPKTSRDTTP